MKIKPRNKSSVEFNLSTQADLVFLLLIFFMITSTMVSPNAIKLLLPNSSSKTPTKQNFEVYINENLEYSILKGKDFAEVRVDDYNQLNQAIEERLAGEPADAAVVVRADKTVPIQNVVYVIDAVNEINTTQNAQHKVVLATAPIPKK
jgi:biopolymer transport protein ExbD